jgi:signal transduction histidine kinase
MILIVDDKPENIFSLKTILQLNNFETDTASSGEEALKKVLKHDYALVILDVQMPGMDGFEVAESMTSLNKTRDIPIIFLSAINTHKRFVARGFESGAMDYITKPVEPDILILKVRNFYRLYEKTKALKEAEKVLKATVDELHSTLETIPQIAFTANPSGHIEFVNLHYFNYSVSIQEFPQTHPEDIPLQQLWLEAIKKEEPVDMEIRIRRLSDGQYRYHLVRAIPVFSEKEIIKWVGTLTDIHEQKSINELLERKVAERTRELLQINRELEISNHDLQQFASVASHDLKEPLRKIQVFGNIIMDREQLNENMSRYMQKIIRSSERMTNLIDDLLAFARLSEAEFFQVTDVNTIIRDILLDLELVIQEKSAVIDLEPLPQIEVIPGLFRQLFQNIISNALKFSRKDVPPLITIRAEYLDEPYFDRQAKEDGPYCRISISDNGIGFEEYFLPKIFTLFQRLNPREEYEGTGIGLAIAKKIVDKHNGLIAARSQPGEGSTFQIILPLRQAATDQQSQQKLAATTLK